MSDLEAPRAQQEYRQLLTKTFLNPDPSSLGVYNALDEVYPAFAKKIFENNDLMRRLVFSGTNPINILSYPICGRCETLALPTLPIVKGGKLIPRCGCVAKGCGHITVNPITFRDWLREELKKKMPKSVIAGIEVAIDSVALSFLKECGMQIKRLEEANNMTFKKAQGLVDSYGSPIRQEKEEPRTEEEFHEKWRKEGYNVRQID